MTRTLLVAALLLAPGPAIATPTDPAMPRAEIEAAHGGVWAILETCYHGADGESCAFFKLPDPFRTLSDCLIAIERADQGLRRIRSQLTSGTCTTGEPM